MNKKVLATMAIALFIVGTLSILSLAPAAEADECAKNVAVIHISPTGCIAKGGTVYIQVSDENRSEHQTHNLTIAVTKPTGASKYKSFSLNDNSSENWAYGADFGTTTNVAGTYKVTVWENYWSDVLKAWCQCVVGEASFTVEAKLTVAVTVWNCTWSEDYEYERCEEVGAVWAFIQYCNGSAMNDTAATVIATLTSPTGGVAKSAPMELVDTFYDGSTGWWGVWVTENLPGETGCLYEFAWDDCSGNWTVGVTAKDSQGNTGYGATSIELSPTELEIWGFKIGYYPDCNTKEEPIIITGDGLPHIFTRCEPVFFAVNVSQACAAPNVPLEEGTVTVHIYAYAWDEDLGGFNFTLASQIYTVELAYDNDEESPWFGLWTATWSIPSNASPVGYPSVTWWDPSQHGDTWWWINVTAADTACGEPNQAEIHNGPMWVTYNTPDIIIETSKAGEETTEFERCETLEITAKVRYHCCNTPFTAAGGGNVSATLMAECDEESLLKTLYLNDTGTHDKDGYEIWTGTYEIKVTDPAAEDGLDWTILVHAWDNAPSPRNEKTETTTVTVSPAEADVKVCAWVDPNAGENGKGYLYVCIKASVCGEPVNGTDPRTVVTVEITRADTGDPLGPMYSTEYPESDPRHVYWSEDTMSWCMNFCVACVAELHPDWLGLWNVTVTVSDPGVCVPNTGTRTVSVPAAVIKETTWINSVCPVHPYSSVWDDCPRTIYINQTHSIGPLSFNATVIDGSLEAKSVKINIYNEDDVLVWTGTMTNTSAIEDEDTVNYTTALPATVCLAPGVYHVETEVTYEGGFSDDVCCAITKPGCPACVVKCPALPKDMECLTTGKCPDNNILAQDGCPFEVVPEINLVDLATLGTTFNPNGWVRFEGTVNDGCGKPLQGVCVNIKIKDPNGLAFGELTGITDEDGKILNAVSGIPTGLLELILPQNAKLGTYNWTVTLSWPGSLGCPGEAVYNYTDANGTPWSFTAKDYTPSDKEAGSFNVYGKLTTMVILSSNLVYNGSSVDILINVQDFFAGTPTTATVTGAVTKPDGTEQALTFTPVGTGIYRATYLVPATAAEGAYTVSYTVSKPLYTGVSGSTAFTVAIKTPAVTITTTTTPPPTITTTITPPDYTGLLYAIAAIAAIAMIAAIAAVVFIARKTR